MCEHRRWTFSVDGNTMTCLACGLTAPARNGLYSDPATDAELLRRAREGRCLRCGCYTTHEPGCTGAARVDFSPENAARLRAAALQNLIETTYSDPLTGLAEDANRHYADAVDQALDGPTTQGEDA